MKSRIVLIRCFMQINVSYLDKGDNLISMISSSFAFAFILEYKYPMFPLAILISCEGSTVKSFSLSILLEKLNLNFLPTAINVILKDS